MTCTIETEIGPGDTVEVWEHDQLQCRAIVQEWNGRGCWIVRDTVTGSTFHIPESYLIKIHPEGVSE